MRSINVNHWADVIGMLGTDGCERFRDCQTKSLNYAWDLANGGSCAIRCWRLGHRFEHCLRIAFGQKLGCWLP